MTDYKQLCGKLADELGKYHARVIEDDGYGSHDTEALLRLADKALAEPEPEGPTDEDLLEIAAAEMSNSPNWPEHELGSSFPYEAPSAAWLNYARAVLARWGTPSSGGNFDG